MKAYIQRVRLDGLIRAGEACEKYGDPYEQISAFRELPNNAVEIVGLCTRCPHCGKGSLRPNHVKATNRAFNSLGLTVEWDRANHKPRRVTMPKEKLADGSDIFNADGTPNKGAIMSGMAHAFHQGEKGHYTFKGSATRVDLPEGGDRLMIVLDRIPTYKE